MDLYINGKKCYLGEEFTPNFSYKFMDTFDPSAIKTGYSKTVTLPDCPENVDALSPAKERYDFVIYDKNLVREKGYCTLDNTTEEGFKKVYNLTLYSELCNFFSNLRGEEDNPKTLCDIRLGFEDTLEEEEYFYQPLTPDFVYQGWRSTGSVSDILKLVPCTWKLDTFDYTKTIVDDTPNFLPRNNPDGTGSCEVSGGIPYLLVTSNENTCVGKHDFRVEAMPIAIRYRNIIEGCCESSSNGGYKVNLDPDFFNEDNPYWTEMFLMNKVPMGDNVPGVTQVESNVYYTWADMNPGIYNGVYRLVTASLISPDTVWTKSSTYIISNYDMVSNNFTITLQPQVTCSYSRNNYYTSWLNGLKVDVVADNGSGQKVSGSLLWDQSDTHTHLSLTDENWTMSSQSLTLSVPNGWHRVRFTMSSSWIPGEPSLMCKLVGQGAIPVRVNGDVILSPTIVSAPVFNTIHFTTGTSPYLNPEFSKKKYLSNTKSPLEYLLNYTKMFNLRFYIHPGTKEIDILTFENYLKVKDPINIDDKIDYGRAYVETRNLINESIINFNLEPEPNQTVQKYYDQEGKNIFDRRVVVKSSGSAVKDYIGNQVLRVGSRSRQTTPYGNLIYVVPGSGIYYRYFGFGQQESITIGYVSGSGNARQIVDCNYNFPGWDNRYLEYDFLEVEDPTDVVVMYAGLKANAGQSPSNNNRSVISSNSKEQLYYAGKPCFIGGFRGPLSDGSTGTFLGGRYKITSLIPIFSVTPSYPDILNGISYANENYDSIQVGSNIFDQYFKDFIDRVYIKPRKVTCWVRLENPELRRLYYFNNSYWILTEVSNYNYNDDPVQCTFVRYCK